MPTQLKIEILHVHHLTGPWEARSDQFPDIRTQFAPEPGTPPQICRQAVVRGLQERIAHALENQILAAGTEEAQKQEAERLLPLTISGFASPPNCDLCVLEGKVQVLTQIMRQRQAIFAEQQTHEAAQSFLQVALMEWMAMKELGRLMMKAEHESGWHDQNCTCQAPAERPGPKIVLTDN